MEIVSKIEPEARLRERVNTTRPSGVVQPTQPASSGGASSVLSQDTSAPQVKGAVEGYSPPEGFKVGGYAVEGDKVTVTLLPDENYLSAHGMTKTENGEYVGSRLPPAYQSVITDFGLQIGQNSPFYHTKEGGVVKAFRVDPRNGKVEIDIENYSVRVEEDNRELSERYAYKGFMSVDQAGGIGTDAEILGNTEAMGKPTLLVAPSVQLLTLSSRLGKGTKVLESSFADVSGAGGIGTDAEILGKTPTYSGDIAKGIVNVIAGVSAWGEYQVGIPHLPTWGAEAEKYQGYTFGSVVPDIVLGATAVSGAVSLTGSVRARLMRDWKLKSFDEMVKKGGGDPLDALQLQESASYRPTTAVERKYTLSAYNDPISTAAEDRLLILRNEAKTDRAVRVGNASPKPDEVRVSGEFFLEKYNSNMTFTEGKVSFHTERVRLSGGSGSARARSGARSSATISEVSYANEYGGSATTVLDAPKDVQIFDRLHQIYLDKLRSQGGVRVGDTPVLASLIGASAVGISRNFGVETERGSKSVVVSRVESVVETGLGKGVVFEPTRYSRSDSRIVDHGRVDSAFQDTVAMMGFSTVTQQHQRAVTDTITTTRAVPIPTVQFQFPLTKNRWFAEYERGRRGKWRGWGDTTRKEKVFSKDILRIGGWKA